MLAVKSQINRKQAYEQRAELFWQAEVSALYRTEAGLENANGLADIYKQYGDLFSHEQVCSLIGMARSQADSCARHIAEFAALRYLRRVTRPYDEAFFAQLAPATLLWDEAHVPFFALTELLAAEPDAQRRQRLYDGRSNLVAKHNDLRRKRRQAIEAEVVGLGYPTYYQLCNELRGLRLANLQAMAETFLRETAATYFSDLAYWGQTILGVDKPDAADMFSLMRGVQFDALFPADLLESTVYQTASRIGIGLSAYPGLEIDLEARPNKSPRPFCAFVRVPHQIKLVVKPVGGHQDYTAVFHEFGHALHGLQIPAHLSFAVRYLGDDSVGEAFAFLFEQLPSNPIWLREILGVEASEAYVSYKQFMRLMFARRCAAKVIYENQLHTGVTLPENLYVDLLYKHLGIHVSSAYYLLDVDDGFYNAQYFRAWVLAAQMTRQLETRIGPDWVVSPSTGAFLRPLWEKGQPSADIIAILIGEGGLNPQALIAQFQK